jgi:hypothetical protein
MTNDSTKLHILLRPIAIKNKTMILIIVAFALYLILQVSPCTNIIIEPLVYIAIASTVLLGIVLNLIKRKWSYLKLLLIIIIVPGILFSFASLFLKSLVCTKAYLRDDLTYFDLKLYKSGFFVDDVYGLFGFKSRFIGSYVVKGDTILFKSRLYDNDFIPRVLLKEGNYLYPVINGVKGKFDNDLEFIIMNK